MRLTALVVACALGWAGAARGGAQGGALDRDARRWVETTLAGLTLEQKAGQMVFASLDSTFLSSDTDRYDELVQLVRETRVGGILVFGGTEPAPDVMLNPTYGSVILGQPLELASVLNRLQAVSALPLMTSADFEWGAGMRVSGATKFPRAMAFGAAGDDRLAFEAGRIMAIESRAMGVHVDLGPVADVNSNPRNPVINIRSFGEDPSRVGALVTSWLRGVHEGGMLVTLKHFPGHGDTEVDSHLGMPIVAHPRDRLDAVELPPFAGGIRAGADGVMVAHIQLPAIDADSGPATFSEKVVTGLLRTTMGFAGLIYSDSMKMEAITRAAAPGEAAVRAVAAGVDVILDSPDPAAAARAIAEAVAAGQIPRARVDQAVGRLLEAKARLGLHRTRRVDVDAVPLSVGGRRHEAVAQEVSDRAITLVKDDRTSVPLRVAPGASVLYLSVLDYPSGWRTAAPSRTVIPELKARWPGTDAIEVSDKTTPDELDMVRAMTARYDIVVAGVFVRAAAASGRLDLAPQVVRLLQDVARGSQQRLQPFVTVFFGSPYAAAAVTGLPTVLLTYDFSDAAERSAVKALAGEIPIGGTLPVSLPGLFPRGHGLSR